MYRRNQAHQVFNIIFHPIGDILRSVILEVGQIYQVLELALDLQFLCLRQLRSARRENLDAVVLIRIVRGGDHHAGREFTLAGEERYGGRGNDPGVRHLGAGGSEAAREGVGNPLV